MRHLKTLAFIIAGLWRCMNVCATTENYPDAASGYTDNGLLWTYTKDSFSAHLYIDGDGEMDNYSSTSLSPWAQYLKYVSNIVIGEGITTIGDYAFYSFSYPDKLKNISIPTTVMSIGQGAFSQTCSTVPLVVIPEGVTTIGADAFNNIGSRNNNRATVVLPSTLRTIGDHAFYCTNGTENSNYMITVYSLASTPPSISGEAFCIDDNEDATVYCPNPSAYSEWLGGAYLGGDGDLIPFSSYGITGNQFWGYNNGTLSLYPSDGKISGHNNINMNSTSSVKINGYVTSVADSAFYGYTNLKSIEIPSTVENIHSSAFEGCISLKTVTIPDDCALLSIGEKAFSGCQSLTSFTIPGSVVGLQSNSFEGCFFAHSNFVNNSRYVNEYTAGATIFTGEEYNGIFIYKEEVVGSRPQLTNITIPNTVTSIGKKAFYGHSSLTSITIPNSVISIGLWAFSGCSGLTSITIPNSVTSIGWRTFEGCSSLTSIAIPNSVTSIESGAFEGCSSLTSIAIPNSVTSIKAGTFSGCSGLTSITIPNSVTNIENGAFEGCSSLTNITIPNSVTSIGWRTFEGCSSLTSIAIPNSVTSIEREAFSGCSELKAVHITDLEAWCNITLEYPPIANEWHLYLNGEEVKDLVIPNSITATGDYTFYGCSGITNITIPNSVTTIGYKTFWGCSEPKAVHITDLEAWCNNITLEYPIANEWYLYLNGEEVKDLVIPNSVTAIEDFTFYGCSGITNITIPNSVTTIGWSAFNKCSSLTNISIPNSVTSIGDYAFYNCLGLTSITIPNSVTSIGFWAFKDCTNLKTVINYSDLDITKGNTSHGYVAYYADEVIKLKPVTGITLDKNDMELTEGETSTLIATIAPSDATDPTITWETSDESVATVNNGVVTAVAPGTAAITAKVGDYTAKCIVNVVKSFVLGDVNGDNLIVVDDVVFTINHILGISSENFVAEAADMTGDGAILVDDVVQIINTVLGVNNVNTFTTRSVIHETWNVSSEANEQGMNNLDITLGHAKEYVAMQFDMTLPTNTHLGNIQLTADSNHSIVFNDMGNEVIRVLITSLTNEAFTKEDLLSISIYTQEDANIRFSNAYVATGQGRIVHLSETEVNTLRSETTRIQIISKENAPADIYDLSGRLVIPKAESLEDLQKGIYLINGKKIIVK